jgi:hypothetical protein
MKELPFPNLAQLLEGDESQQLHLGKVTQDKFCEYVK